MKNEVFIYQTVDVVQSFMSVKPENPLKFFVPNINSFLINKNRSNYVKHFNKESHIFDRKFKILHVDKKGLYYQETLEIEINTLKHSGLLLQGQLDRFE